MSGLFTARATLAALPFAVLFVAAWAAAAAQEALVGFRSPSNNIHCQFHGNHEGSDDAAAAIRCDIMQISNRAPSRPRDCELDWGQAFEISRKAAAGARICHGDTVMDDRLPALPYGKTWQRHGLTCTSKQGGVTCVNAKGHGFDLSRGAQRVF